MTEISLPAAGGASAALAYDPGTQALYLDAPGVGLTIVDPGRKAAMTTVATSGSPGGITFDQDLVYVAALGQNHIEVIHKGDWSVQPGVDAPETLSGGIWTDPAHSRLFALTQQGNVLIYQAGAAPQLEATHAIGASGPGTFAASSGILYVAAAGQLNALDVNSGQTRNAALPDASTITALAYDDRTGLLWATTEDHQLLVLDGKTLQPPQTSGVGDAGTAPPSTNLAAPSSANMDFDAGLRFIYTFGAGGFGAYDTNFDIQSAQVDTGDPSMSNGAVDATNHNLYTYEPAHHVLGVYSWGAHGSAFTGPGGGGGTSQPTTGGGGGGSAGPPSAGLGSSPAGGGVGSAASPSTGLGSSPPGAGAGTTGGVAGAGPGAAPSSPAGFGATSSGGYASGGGSAGGVSTTATGGPGGGTGVSSGTTSASSGVGAGSSASGSTTSGSSSSGGSTVGGSTTTGSSSRGSTVGSSTTSGTSSTIGTSTASGAGTISGSSPT